MERTIVVKTQYEGIHCWPEAPDEVKFLRSLHRHIFNIEVEVEVHSDDRDIEFIMLKHTINHWLSLQFDDDGVWQMGRLSCEQVAEMVIDLVQEKLKDKTRVMSCCVDEDGENGAKVVYNPSARSCDRRDNKMYIEAHEGETPMTLAEYQANAYVAIQEHDSTKEEVMHWAIGLGEEAGETLSVVKHKYYGGQYNVEELVGELGDTLWHIGALCSVLGIQMEDVAKYNLGKLHFRYPDGQFDNERSIRRHDLKFAETDEAKLLMAKIKSDSELH